jgi:hypothetical protein
MSLLGLVTPKLLLIVVGLKVVVLVELAVRERLLI